ncbi:hypothetical protein ACUOA8_20825, partial [Escherichia sp. SS-MK2]
HDNGYHRGWDKRKAYERGIWHYWRMRRKRLIRPTR